MWVSDASEVFELAFFVQTAMFRIAASIAAYVFNGQRIVHLAQTHGAIASGWCDVMTGISNNRFVHQYKLVKCTV